MKISACLVIRNEEKLLSRCLDSIKNVVDEIVVVHDGPCEDKSLEIAKRYKTRVYIQSYIGEAEYHRPFSYEKAHGEWILQIDADEFLSNKAQKEITKLVINKNIDAYSFLWLYPGKSGYIKTGPFSKTLKPSLFKKNKMFMIGISHEFPRTYGILVKKPEILLNHKPLYDNFSLHAFREKWVNWAKLQAKQIYFLEKAPIFNINKAEENSIYRHYLFIRSHPIISGITESFKFLIIYLTRGILWSSLYSVKVAFFELKYLWLVRFNLLKLKYGRKLQ